MDELNVAVALLGALLGFGATWGTLTQRVKSLERRADELERARVEVDGRMNRISELYVRVRTIVEERVPGSGERITDTTLEGKRFR